MRAERTLDGHCSSMKINRFASPQSVSEEEEGEEQTAVQPSQPSQCRAGGHRKVVLVNGENHIQDIYHLLMSLTRQIWKTKI